MDEKFVQYKDMYSKSYQTSEEYQFRKELFEKKDKIIEEWNAKEGVTHQLGHNKFSDLTEFELKKSLGFVQRPNATKREPVVFNTTDLPASVNWVTAGAVNAVQDQGQCGSCWSFSAIAAMEGAHFVKTKELIKLSEQQCVDCQDLDYGCKGGMPEDCMLYGTFQEINSEQQYPYNAKDGQCNQKLDGVLTVDNIHDVQENSVDQLKAAVVLQPVSVLVEADHPIFHQYKSGIITSTDCGVTLDHAVLAVGYGTENGVDYFLVRNSWTADWGEKGYVRIAAVGGAGICGIQKVSVYADTS